MRTRKHHKRVYGKISNSSSTSEGERFADHQHSGRRSDPDDHHYPRASPQTRPPQPPPPAASSSKPFTTDNAYALYRCDPSDGGKLKLVRHVQQRHGFNLVKPRADATDVNDDACMICADGGDLLCCEKCPSTFHPSCMGVEVIPHGEWLCPFCVCKFCGTARAGDLLHECKQCERRHHSECFFLRQPFYPDCPMAEFCGNNCREVFTKIHKTCLGVRHELDNGYTWSLVRCVRETEPPADLEVDLQRRSFCNSKVEAAWRVMEELFLPNIDRLTDINIIQSVVFNYGSNLRRINFRGFYTAILEKNDEIISVASLRVHGKKIAEMPFVGTREGFRRLGMLQKLLTAVESVLRLLEVENLVIPSVPELVSMWKEKHHFSDMDNDMMKEITNFNTLSFPRAIRLRKSLVAQAAEAEPSVPADERVTAAKNNETGDASNNNLAKLARFDLNLEPPYDDDDA